LVPAKEKLLKKEIILVKRTAATEKKGRGPLESGMLCGTVISG
jgi:hypothetical protein